MTSPVRSRNEYLKGRQIKPKSSVWLGLFKCFVVLFVFIGLGKISKFAETGMVRLADNNVVKNFDFQKLPGTD